jgi:hypothetical protein
MNLHRLRVDVGLERGKVVGKRGQLMSHRGSPPVGGITLRSYRT